MNVRSNGSWGSVYGDNLFAVIRQRKWFGDRRRIRRSRIIDAAKLQNTFRPLRSDSMAVRYMYGCLFKDSGNVKISPHTMGIPFSRTVFVSWMGSIGPKLFAEIGILFTVFVGCCWPLQHPLVSIYISESALHDFIGSFLVDIKNYFIILDTKLFFFYHLSNCKNSFV